MILVVEPHWETCRAFERLLSFHGYHVRSVSGFQQALQLLQHFHPRVILANKCELADDLTCHQLEALLKQNPKFQSIGLVSYEAREPSAEADATLNFGARDCLHRAGVRWSELLPQIEALYEYNTPADAGNTFISG